MTFNLPSPGHSPIIVGAIYSRSLHVGATRARLRRYSEKTGTCVMVSTSGYVFYLTSTELSNWHLVERP